MKEINKYIACDGKEFESKELCCSYEADLYGIIEISYMVYGITKMYVVLVSDKVKELDAKEIWEICYYIAERKFGRRLSLNNCSDEPDCNINAIVEDLVNGRNSIFINWVVSKEIKYINQKEFEEQIIDKHEFIMI